MMNTTKNDGYIHYTNLDENIKIGIETGNSELLDICYNYAYNCTDPVAASHCHKAVTPHKRWHLLRKHLYYIVEKAVPHLIDESEVKPHPPMTSSLIPSFNNTGVQPTRSRYPHESAPRSRSFGDKHNEDAEFYIEMVEKYQLHPTSQDHVIKYNSSKTKITKTNSENTKVSDTLYKKCKTVTFDDEPKKKNKKSSKVLDQLVLDQRKDEAIPMKYSNAFTPVEHNSANLSGLIFDNEYNRNNNLYKEITTIKDFADDAYRKVFSTDNNGPEITIDKDYTSSSQSDKNSTKYRSRVETYRGMFQEGKLDKQCNNNNKEDDSFMKIESIPHPYKRTQIKILPLDHAPMVSYNKTRTIRLQPPEECTTSESEKDITESEYYDSSNTYSSIRESPTGESSSVAVNDTYLTSDDGSTELNFNQNAGNLPSTITPNNTNSNAIKTIVVDGVQYSSEHNPCLPGQYQTQATSQVPFLVPPQYQSQFQGQYPNNPCQTNGSAQEETVQITKRKALLGMRSDGNEYNVMYMCDPRTPDLIKRIMIIPEQFVASRFVQIPDLPKTAIDQLKSKVKDGYMSDTERERLLELEDQELAITEKLADERQEMSDELKLSKQKAKLDVEYKKIVKLVKEERKKFDKKMLDLQLAMNIEIEKSKKETLAKKKKILKKIKKIKKLQSLTQTEWVERKENLRKKLEEIQHKIRALKKLRLRWKLGRRLIGLRKSMHPQSKRRIMNIGNNDKTKTDKSVLLDRMKQLDIRKKALERQNFRATTDLYQNMNLDNMEGGQLAWNQQLANLGLYDTPEVEAGQFAYANDPMTTGQLMPSPVQPVYDYSQQVQPQPTYGDADSIGSANDLLLEPADPYGQLYEQEPTPAADPYSTIYG